jgi:hypothetical protein
MGPKEVVCILGKKERNGKVLKQQSLLLTVVYLNSETWGKFIEFRDVPYFVADSKFG